MSYYEDIGKLFFKEPEQAISLQLPWEEQQDSMLSPEDAPEELLDELTELYHKLIEDKQE